MNQQNHIDRVYHGAIFTVLEEIKTPKAGKVIAKPGDKVFCMSSKIKKGCINALVIDGKNDSTIKLPIAILAKSMLRGY